jgi:hypothetical protein
MEPNPFDRYIRECYTSVCIEYFFFSLHLHQTLTMAQLAVSMAAILLIALVSGGTYGFPSFPIKVPSIDSIIDTIGIPIKPPPIDSIIDNSGIPIPDNIKAALRVGPCTTACGGGVTAMEAFCPLISNSDVHNACLSASNFAGSTDGIAACTGFCNQYFV